MRRSDIHQDFGREHKPQTTLPPPASDMRRWGAHFIGTECTTIGIGNAHRRYIPTKTFSIVCEYRFLKSNRKSSDICIDAFESAYSQRRISKDEEGH